MVGWEAGLIAAEGLGRDHGVLSRRYKGSGDGLPTSAMLHTNESNVGRVLGVEPHPPCSARIHQLLFSVLLWCMSAATAVRIAGPFLSQLGLPLDHPVEDEDALLTRRDASASLEEQRQRAVLRKHQEKSTLYTS